MKENRLYSIIVSVILLFVLAVTSVISILLPDKTYSEKEKRFLQTFPELSANGLVTRVQEQKFTQQYENYVADQFPMRDQFVALKNNTEILLGKRDIGGVYLGTDNYLFSKEDSLNCALLTTNLNDIQTFSETLAETNPDCNVTVALAPDSAHVLAEQLPPFATIYDYENVNLAASEILGNDYVNLKPILDLHSGETIYYRNDHHWTTLGAYYAYTELSSAMNFTPHKLEEYQQTIVSDNFKGTYSSKINIPVQADQITRFDLKTGGTLTATLDGGTYDSIYFEEALQGSDQYNYFLKGNYPITRIETDTDNNRRLLIVKDSYAHSLVPFLKDHFETIICIDLRSYRESTLKLCESENITDVLFLYQATNFSKDQAIRQLNLK